MGRILDELRKAGCEIDFLSELKTRDDWGNPSGKLMGNPFYITFAKNKTDQYFMLTVGEGADFRKAVEKLSKVTTDFMGTGPIISYEEKEPNRITLEWDLIDPEGRIRKIVNGGEEFAKLKLSNIELFGERKLIDYQDDAEMQKNRKIEAERVKNARIYGKDPGELDVKKIEKMSERELFEIFFAITYEVWAIDHNGRRDFSRGYITKGEWMTEQKRLSELQYSTEYLLYFISKKIGIPVSEPEVDKHIRPDKELFMKWYNFHEKKLSGDWRTSTNA